MEKLESLLREEFSTAPTHPRASVSELVATTRRLRRRRTAMSSVAAALSVVLVLVIGLLVVRGGTGRPQVVSTPGPVDPIALQRLSEELYRGGGPMGGGLVDADRGYVVKATCPDMQSGPLCTVRLLVTSDGGATFTAGPTLPTGDRRVNFATLWVFEDGGLVYDEVPESASAPTDGPGLVDGAVHRRWASADGGLTWSPAPATPAGPVTTIPAGAKLMQGLWGRANTDKPAVITSDGTMYTLDSAPPGTVAVPRFAMNDGDPFGGSFLLADGDGQLWISTDRGRTWQPSADEDSRGAIVVGESGGRIYAVAGITFFEDDNTAPPNLLVSADGGFTWTDVALPQITPRVGATPGRYGPVYFRWVTMAALPAGGVLLADGARMWRVPPGGDAFEEVSRDDGRFVLSMRGTVLLLRHDGARLAAELTTDGRQWRPSNLIGG
jgi:hypothetical protein